MVEVKEEYKNQYKTLLAEDIKKNYDGNLEKILLGLIKGESTIHDETFFPPPLPLPLQQVCYKHR